MVQIKLFVVSASCTPLLVPCRVVLLPIQLSANVPEKIAKDSPSAWPSDTHVGDPVGILGSCFWAGSDLAVVAYWGSNRGWEMCVCVCVHVSVHVFVSVSQLLHCTKLNFIYSLVFATLLPQYFSMLLPLFMSSCYTT